jgi:hypothetical protein
MNMVYDALRYRSCVLCAMYCLCVFKLDRTNSHVCYVVHVFLNQINWFGWIRRYLYFAGLAAVVLAFIAAEIHLQW